MCQAQAAGACDGAQPQRSVASGARKDDADRVGPLIVGQGAHETVDGHALAAIGLWHAELQHAVENFHFPIGGYDIDMVGGNLHLVLGLNHWHGGAALQDFTQDAAVGWIEVLHQYQRHATVRRHGAQKLFEGLESACRRAQADDGELGRTCGRRLPGRAGRLVFGLVRGHSLCRSLCRRLGGRCVRFLAVTELHGTCSWNWGHSRRRN